MNKYTIKFTECKEMDGILGKLAELDVFLKKKLNETSFYL